MPTLFREVTDTDKQITAPADGADYHLGIIGSTGVVNIDLPLLSTVNLGQRFTIACQDGGASTNQINVRRQSPDLIQGATTFAINIGYGTATFLSNGRQYVVDSSSVPHVLPISGGGTGADTAEGAVDNLGLDVKEPVTAASTTRIKDEAVTAAKISSAVVFNLTNTQEMIGSVTEQKIHAGAGVGGTVQVGATLLQATSGAIATVTAYTGGGTNRFTVTGITGTFDTTNLVTGTNPDTSAFTFTPSETLLDCWGLTATPAAFSVIATMTGPLQQTIDGLDLSTGQCRYIFDTNQIETLNSDAYSIVGAEFCPSTTSSHS